MVLRISEAKDIGEFDRLKFCAHIKAYLAAPPDVLRVDEKNLREHSVFNFCGVVLTANHKITASTSRPTIGGTSWPGATARRPTSTKPTGATSGDSLGAKA
jgi:hypothetical protein